ncbi:MAG: hypothetical protein ACRD4L_10400, partial [Pyrinomonadaceae bacterium]
MNYFNYFTEIEETFVRRRNKHLMLSPMDWALIESWKQIGIPLHVALRGIEIAFDSHDKKRRQRSVKTLFYCQEEVEAQFAEWLETRVGSTNQGTNDLTFESSLPFPRAEISEHLKKCLSRLEQARESLLNETSSDLKNVTEFDDGLIRTLARLSELADDFSSSAKPDAQALEASLSQLEDYVITVLQKSIDPECLISIRAMAEKELRPVIKKVQTEMRAQLIDNMTQKLLREKFR